MSTIRQRGTAAVLLLLHYICSVSVYRASTGSTQFPTVELVDPEGCFQGVKSLNLYNPIYRDNLLATPLRTSPVRILTHLDNRDHRLGREERRLILSIRRHRNHPLACRHTLHIKPLRRQHQDRSITPRATYLHRSLALTGPVPPVRVPCPVVATRLIQRPAHHPPPRLHPLLTNYWQ
jgi:hypothetical protein